MNDLVSRLRAMPSSLNDALRTMDDAADRIEALDAALQLSQSMSVNAVLQARIEALETALERIEQWSGAYPLDIFPEPDWKRATELLKAGGITMDAVSAHCMRHVVDGVGKIARAALDKDAGK